MSDERRYSKRRHVVWKAIISRLNGEQFMGSTANVSDDGMFIIIDKPLIPGERLHIDVVSKCTGRACFFSLHGGVVYNRLLEYNLGVAIGVRLEAPDQAYVDMINSCEPLQRAVLAS
ncbi:MAG: PilZ domain-containing protein [Motiliproteus sp.]